MILSIMLLMFFSILPKNTILFSFELVNKSISFGNNVGTILLVFITENTNYISNTYTKPLISIVEKKSGLNLNINNLETRWH